ncbi:MAG: hypothetical protein UV38_C0003G0112 [candidate division TM6 bacterium GW2011_GWE2_42_60]|nr:MAG: hypothetical protein UV38_C0003G0112 [candidate division TM6 bacterium GW2011_GWE2_42_60]HBY05409.1 hypothetical protein [Candidatus Dependentiae bacterium]
MVSTSRLRFSLLFLLCATQVKATIQLAAIKDTAVSFPFAIQQYAYNKESRYFFVGAHEAPAEKYKDASVSTIGPNNTYFVGLTPEKITLNAEKDQANPLYGAVISQLSLLESCPLIVTQAEGTKLYSIRSFSSNSTINLISSEELLDANHEVCNGIFALAGIANRSSFLAVVKPHGGNFGQINSAFVPGSVQKTGNDLAPNYVLKTAESVPLNVSSDALKIGNDLTSIDNQTAGIPVTLYGSETLGVFYSGYAVTSANDPMSGARSVIYGAGSKITPDDVLAPDSIIGGNPAGAQAQFCTHHIATMSASTGLDYLVVVGGKGDPTTTKQDVYALPLIGTGENAGTLAKKTAIPFNFYNATLNNRLIGRAFVTAPTGIGDLFSPTDLDIYKAKVGGEGTLPGDIKKLFVEKDTVFVSVFEDNILAHEHGGIFASQALFQANGCIMGWTDWHRVAGSMSPQYGLVLDNVLGQFTLLNGATADSLTAVERTQWGTNTFENSVNMLSSQVKSGFQFLADFPRSLNAFDQTLGNRVSLVCATGYRAVALIQSGYDDTYFEAQKSLNHTALATDASTRNGIDLNTDSILFTGGVLDDLNGIIAAEIISDATHSWLVVGGNGGIAVLANEDGAGWAVGQLGPNFENLPLNLFFQKVGSFKNVRKLIAQDDQLFVLTTDALYRFTASATVFTGEPEVELLASVPSLSLPTDTSFSDLALSGRLALLATSRGLFRVGNGRSIMHDTEHNLAWTQITLPEGAGSVARFFVVSPTDKAIDFATTERGGNIYILNACVSLNQARVYRLSILGMQDPISDYTATLFKDHFFEDVNPTFYYDRGSYRNYIATDGAMFFMSRSSFYPVQLNGTFEAINPVIHTGIIPVAGAPRTLISSRSLSMGPLFLRSANGSWMIGGDHVYTND